MLDHIAEPERTRIIITLMAVGVSAGGLLIGITVPFASAWLTQRIIQRREYKKDLLKLLVDLSRQTSEFRAAIVDAFLANYQAEGVAKALGILDGEEMAETLEKLKDESVESLEESVKLNDAHLENLRKRTRIALDLISTTVAIDLVCDKRGEPLVKLVHELCEVPDPNEWTDSPERIGTAKLEAFEEKVTTPKVQQIMEEMQRLWSSVK